MAFGRSVAECGGGMREDGALKKRARPGFTGERGRTTGLVVKQNWAADFLRTHWEWRVAAAI